MRRRPARIDEQTALDFPIAVPHIRIKSRVRIINKAAMIYFDVIELPMETRYFKSVRVNSAKEILESNALEIKILRRNKRADGFDAVGFLRALGIEFDVSDDDLFRAFADAEKCLISSLQRNPAVVFAEDIVRRRVRVQAVHALNDDARRQSYRRSYNIFAFGKRNLSAVVRSDKSKRALDRNRVISLTVADCAEIPDVIKSERPRIGRGNPIVSYVARILVAVKCNAIAFVLALETPFQIGGTRLHRSRRAAFRQRSP